MPIVLDQSSSAAFSPDGTMIAIGAQWHQVVLIDAGTWRRIGAPIDVELAPSDCVSSPCHPVDHAVFSPDGAELAVAVPFEGVTILDVSTKSWLAAACHRAGAGPVPDPATRAGLTDDSPCG